MNKGHLKNLKFEGIKIKKLFFAIIVSAIIGAAASVAPVAAQTETELRLPDEVKPFVLPGTAAIALRTGDLNGDGTLDYILVLNRTSADVEYSDHETDDRPTLLIVGDRNGKYSVAARNDSIVTCAGCDAPFANPFEGISIGKNNFTIKVQTGSKAHLIYKYTFRYTPREKNWRLSRVVETDYDVYKDTSATLVYTAPRNFDNIAFADFRSLEFRGAGTRLKSPPAKTRFVTVYVHGEFDPDKGMKKIVPVQREIVDYRPLDQAFKLFLEGPTEDEENRGLSRLVFDLKFYSARIRNKTAEINLRLEREEYIQESWEGAGFMPEQFVEAVELTAKQFPGVERVSICINGIENYLDFGATKNKKCPFPMFAPAKLPEQPR